MQTRCRAGWMSLSVAVTPQYILHRNWNQWYGICSDRGELQFLKSQYPLLEGISAHTYQSLTLEKTSSWWKAALRTVRLPLIMHKKLNTRFAGFTHTHLSWLRALTDCRKTFDVLEFWADDVPSSSLRRQMSTRRWRSMWFGITTPQFQQCNILCDTVQERIQEPCIFT